MYLYDRQKGKFVVYNATMDEEKAYNYRKEQMEQIPEAERVLVSRGSTKLELPLEHYLDQLDSFVIPIEELVSDDKDNRRTLEFYEGKSEIDEKIRLMLLRNFLTGDYHSKPVARVQEADRLRYMLLTTDVSGLSWRGTEFIKSLSGILEIPESLFLLQMIQQRKPEFLEGKDLSEQLSLFDVSKVDSFTVDTLRKMDHCGVTEDAYDRVRKQSKKDAKILQLLKERN